MQANNQVHTGGKDSGLEAVNEIIGNPKMYLLLHFICTAMTLIYTLILSSELLQ